MQVRAYKRDHICRGLDCRGSLTCLLHSRIECHTKGLAIEAIAVKRSCGCSCCHHTLRIVTVSGFEDAYGVGRGAQKQIEIFGGWYLRLRWKKL
jgi:hypothetical protein